ATQLNINYTQEPGLRNMEMKPLLDNVVNMINGPLFIPANTIKNFTEKFVVPSDISLISITPHMHLIGTRLKVYAYNPASHDTVRIIDDRWNFHWQGMYMFPKIVHLKKGYTLYAEGTYNNTMSNVDNPNNPPRDV